MMNDVNRRATVVLASVFLIMASGVGAAASLTAGGGVTYETTNDVAVTVTNTHDAGTANPFKDNGRTVALNDVVVRSETPGNDFDFAAANVNVELKNTETAVTASGDSVTEPPITTDTIVGISRSGDTRDGFAALNGSDQSKVDYFDGETAEISRLGIDAALIESADTNGDGDDELVYKASSDGSLTVFDPVSNSVIQSTTQNVESDLTAVDTDDDGDQEVAFRANGGDLFLYDAAENTFDPTSENASRIADSGVDRDGDGTKEVLFYREGNYQTFDPDSNTVEPVDIDTTDGVVVLSRGRDRVGEILYNNGSNINKHNIVDGETVTTPLTGIYSNASGGDLDGDNLEEVYAKENDNLVAYDPITNSVEFSQSASVNSVDTKAYFDRDADGSDEVIWDFSGTIEIVDLGDGATIKPTDGESFAVGNIQATDEQTRVSDSVAADDGATDIRYAAGSSMHRGVIHIRDVLSPGQRYGFVENGNVLSAGVANEDGSVTASVPTGTGTTQLVTPSNPAFDNQGATPSGGTIVDGPDISFEVGFSDSDFAGEGGPGDEVDVALFIDGEKRAETTRTSSGQVQFVEEVITGGEHTWSVRATDAYGNVVRSDTFEFGLPGTVSVFREDKPTQLIDTSETPLEARFFAQDSEEIITKDITSGTVSLAGLPTGKPFVVTIRGNNTEFNFRRVYIESLKEDTEVYVLRDSVATSNVVYTIDDPTGTFTRRRTILEVEKPITKDFDDDGTNETEYRTVAGDRFGTAGEFPTELQTDSRYRLVITSPNGETRELGGYQVKGSQRVELSIQSEEFDALPKQNGLAAQTEWVEPSNGGPAIDLKVAHPNLESGTVEISYRENGTTIYQKSLTGNLSTQVAAANNSEYVANISADIGDETVELQRQISSGRIATGGQVDNQWMQLFAMAALLIVGGLFTRANAGVGAIVTASLGGVFWFLELLGGVATGGMIVVALFIGVLSYAKRRGQGVAT